MQDLKNEGMSCHVIVYIEECPCSIRKTKYDDPNIFLDLTQGS